MNDEQFESLLDAATEGVSFDGLAVRREDDGYHWGTPEREPARYSRSGLREVAQTDAAYVTNWDYWTNQVGAPDSARYEFLRWLERAEDVPVNERYERLAAEIRRTWGQLAITTRLGGAGQRRYELRHERDEHAPPTDLERYHDPAAAREIARFDAADRYRPLSTAPTLQDGWVFPDLAGDQLVRAVETFYPATIANWARERAGALDVTHWTDTANRQTGMYDVVDELAPEAVAWAAEACCTDDACLKRRQWDVDDERDLDVPRGAGEFPCREACSMFVAAAREWAIGERESPRTYEFELTPTEKAQLEALVDAVATDGLADVREGAVDDPANRYRVRYLRAKLFDDGRFADAVASPIDDEGGRADGSGEE